MLPSDPSGPSICSIPVPSTTTISKLKTFASTQQQQEQEEELLSPPTTTITTSCYESQACSVIHAILVADDHDAVLVVDSDALQKNQQANRPVETSSTCFARLVQEWLRMWLGLLIPFSYFPVALQSTTIDRHSDHSNHNNKLSRKRYKRARWFRRLVLLYCCCCLIFLVAAASSTSTTNECHPTNTDSVCDPLDHHQKQQHQHSNRQQHQSSNDQNRDKKKKNPLVILCTVDGNILVLDAYIGTIHGTFSSGQPLVGPSSSLQDNRRIVPALDGQLYIASPPTPQNVGGILQPLAITVLDVLQSPVKTCTAENTDCGIVTATKATSLFALNAATGELIWYQAPNGTTTTFDGNNNNNSTTSGSSSSRTKTVLLQREDTLVQQLSTDSGGQVWNVTLGAIEALDFGGDYHNHQQHHHHQQQQPEHDTSSVSNRFKKNKDNSLLPSSNEATISASSTSTSLDRYRSKFQQQSNQAPSLPSVVFGTDGMSISGVDDNRHILWTQDFSSVVVSAFGLSGNAWKPLTVLEEEFAVEEHDHDHPNDHDHHHRHGTLKNQNSANAFAPLKSSHPYRLLPESNQRQNLVGGGSSSTRPLNSLARKDRPNGRVQSTASSSSSFLGLSHTDLSTGLAYYRTPTWQQFIHNQLGFGRLREHLEKKFGTWTNGNTKAADVLLNSQYYPSSTSARICALSGGEGPYCAEKRPISYNEVVTIMPTTTATTTTASRKISPLHDNEEDWNGQHRNFNLYSENDWYQSMADNYNNNDNNVYDQQHQQRRRRFHPRLALPSSPPDVRLQRTPDGLFLTWPLVAALVVAILVVIAGSVRFLYLKKKNKWLKLIARRGRSQSLDMTFDLNDNSNNSQEETNSSFAKKGKRLSNVSFLTEDLVSGDGDNDEPGATKNRKVLRRSHSQPLPAASSQGVTPRLSGESISAKLRTAAATSTGTVFSYSKQIGSMTDAVSQDFHKDTNIEITVPSTAPITQSRPTQATSMVPVSQQEKHQNEQQRSQPAPSPPPPTQGVGSIDGIPLIRYSRYDSEFNELIPLGKGGFGSVFRCRNALDGREYAIKKVFIKHDSRRPTDFSQRLKRVLREVKILALLDHNNIVRYYTAWLELEQQDESAGSTNDSCGGATSSYFGAGAYDSGFASKTAASFIPRRYSSELLANPSYTTSNTMDHRGKRQTGRNDRTDLMATKKVTTTNYNPLGWNSFTSNEESTSLVRFGGHATNHNVPFELEDYGFTFERSEHNSASFSSAEDNQQHSAAVERGGVSTNSTTGRHNNRHLLFGADDSDSQSDSASWSKETDSRAQSMPTSHKDQKGFKGSKNQSDKATAVIVRHTLYIQMQLCSQKTLADFLANKEARRGPSGGDDVDIPYALSLFLQVAQGVKHVHAQGLIHRDLKPNNCFIDDAGIVKVGDFGLSRESGDKEDSTDTSPNKQALGGDGGGDNTAGVGTRSYASPEQMNGSDYDSSTDVYSLGIILFELCYPMYTGMERHIVLSKLRTHIFPEDWVAKVTPTFPTLQPLLLSMISNRPSDRPTAKIVADSIQSILEGFTISSLDDKHQKDGSILLRVEVKPRQDVLSHTMQLVKKAAAPHEVEIPHYGLRSGTNKAIMEFAVTAPDEAGVNSLSADTPPCESVSLGSTIVAALSKLDEVLLVRQVLAAKYT